MEQFNYKNTVPRLMTTEVVSALNGIREHRGRESFYVATAPELLDKLSKSATIQSTGASSRIERISTSQKRLVDLLEKNADPINRFEREISGYSYALDRIKENYANILVTPNSILQLHHDMFRFQDAPFAGHWKDPAYAMYNRASSDKMFARFHPTPSEATPSTIEALCTAYNSEIERGELDSLLLSLMFVFDFTCIQPFANGNGRMSRLLMLLLMCRNGYTVGRYISIEHEIERSRDAYRAAFRKCAFGWDKPNNNRLPFIRYMLGVVSSCYKILDERYLALTSGISNEDALRGYFANLLGSASKQDVIAANPGMSKRTIERLLQKFQAEGFVEKVGAARATRYRRAR